MKKKIKDLTRDECRQICDKNEWCYNCPLNETIRCLNYDKNSLEREVEVDEQR